MASAMTWTMDRYHAARRRQARPGKSALGYWLPLVVTVTIATAGLAAWIWSERQQDDDDDDDDDHHDNDDIQHDTYDHPLDYPEELPDEQIPPSETHHQRGFLSRVPGRTPSPQQFFDGAGQRIRSAVGHKPQQERNDPAFSDNEHWNEEAENNRTLPPSSSTSTANNAKRTVAVVLSADNDHHHHDESTHRADHPSLLSHLASHVNPSTTNLFILLYAPNLSSLPPLPSSDPSTTSFPSLFTTLHQTSLSLTSPAQILPFSTPTGYIHILRHLSPSLVYLSDLPVLSGRHGSNVAQLKGWVGQTIVVVGDDGVGGLADTETETEDEASRRAESKEQRKWWQGSELVGLGKGVEVVDIARLGEDWVRRVGAN